MQYARVTTNFVVVLEDKEIYLIARRVWSRFLFLFIFQTRWNFYVFFFFSRHISDCNYYNMFVLFNMDIILCISDLKKKKNQTKHTIIILLYMIRLYRMKYKFTYVYNMFINDDVSTICMYVCSMRLNMKTSC